MSTLTAIMLSLLILFSLALVVFTAKQNWKWFAICLVSIGILDLLLIKYG